MNLRPLLPPGYLEFNERFSHRDSQMSWKLIADSYSHTPPAALAFCPAEVVHMADTLENPDVCLQS